MGVLTTEEVEAFWRDGYLVGPVLLDAEEVASLRSAVDRVHGGDLEGDGAYPLFGRVLGDPDTGAARTVMYGWRVNEVIRRLVCGPKLAAMAAAILRTPRVRLWQDQVISKPPTTGDRADGTIGFHQDYPYWQDVSTDAMVTANVALQDTDDRNGALHVLSGSHRIGIADWAGSFFDTDLDEVRSRLPEVPGVSLEEVTLPLRAGQVSFHHSLTVHGSGPNRSDRPRMTIAPAYLPDGAVYRPHQGPPSPHSRFLGEPVAGTPYDGDAFPLVHDASAAG
jgi:ectoine hydroxylase-related dioxygenase (phytanoyl-CoA dioxygenase family)